MSILELQKKYYESIPQIDFDLILSSVVGRPKEFLFTHPQYRLSIKQSIRLRYFVFLFKKNYSIAAITGHKEFYGLDFFVNKHVLIPRPDTEIMVEEAIREIDNQTILIDVGTGSGCIPISILANLKQPVQTYAVDISKQALKVAKKNARTHNVHINFFHGNLLKPILKSYNLQAKKLLITANLPYLTEKQFQNEPSIQREPKKALVADNNGLALYEELLKQTKLLPTTHSLLLLIEIDPSQTQEISKLIKQYLPNSSMEIKKDLCGLDRIVKISVA